MSGSVQKRQHEMRQRLDAALGTLGLHNQRLVTIQSVNGHPSAEASCASVSIAELEKLAARAEHLVELERGIYDWYVGEPEDLPEAFNISAVIEWARAHDFSMLEPPEPPTFKPGPGQTLDDL